MAVIKKAPARSFVGEKSATYNSDCVEVLGQMPDASIDLSIFSPPFVALYTFSDKLHDMSNCRGYDEFFSHYGYFAEHLARVMKPGRLAAIHCMNVPTKKSVDGFIGIRDFRGDIIRTHQQAGMIYHSEVCIWKNPVSAMQRTKSIRLLHKQLVKDSSMSGQGLADYLVVMRKPGINTSPVKGPLVRYFGDQASVPKKDPGGKQGHIADSYSVKIWQRYASPVWMDIDQSDVLSRTAAREHDDERHIAPLQLTVIRRALDLWSNAGDTVLDPFAGIGSTGYVALQMARRFVGVELKPSYYKQMINNLNSIPEAL